MGLGLPRPPDAWPRREESGVCTQEMAPGDLFERGVKGRALASSSWPFPFPRCSHLPLGPGLAPWGSHVRSKPPANNESLSQGCGVWALVRGLPAPTPSILTGLWGPAPPAPVQTVVPLASSAAARALVLTLSRRMEPKGLQPERRRSSRNAPCLFFFFFPSAFPQTFKDSLEATVGTYLSSCKPTDVRCAVLPLPHTPKVRSGSPSRGAVRAPAGCPGPDARETLPSFHWCGTTGCPSACSSVWSRAATSHPLFRVFVWL